MKKYWNINLQRDGVEYFRGRLAADISVYTPQAVSVQSLINNRLKIVVGKD